MCVQEKRREERERERRGEGGKEQRRAGNGKYSHIKLKARTFLSLAM